MTDASFASQFSKFHLRNNGVWSETVPVIGVEYTRSATDLSGSYTITLPNLNHQSVSVFNQFDFQELWFACTWNGTMYRAFTGQVNSLPLSSDYTLKLGGRGLTGMLTDQKVSQSWTSKRGDFILCDPTYGLIPKYYPQLTTWGAFTDDFDRFDYWETNRWGAQPSWTDVTLNQLTITGSGSATETLTDTTSYDFETVEFYASVSLASNYVRFGLTDATRTNYVYFELASSAVNCKNSDGVGSQSSATTDAITQTNFNYYRIEWAAGLVNFFVNGKLEATQSLNVPVALLHPFMEADQTASTVTVNYVKMIQLTTLFDTYVTNDKIALDIVSDITDVGNTNTDFTFYIDDDWDFHAHPSVSKSSGFFYGLRSSTYTSVPQQIMQLETNSEAKDLYNSVKVRGGNVLNTVNSPNWTDQFTGNGTQTAFALGYASQNPITLLTIGGVTKTEGTDFTVTYGTEHTIVQFAAAPAAAAAINVRYNYYTPIIATSSNQNSISSYNNTTRTYSVNDETITSQSRASNLANALLAFYSDPRAVIKVTVPMDPRLQVGTTVKIDAPDFGINLQTYDIIELTGTMGQGTFSTMMTLSNAEINTSGEIIREILQQLKSLKNRGDTNAISLDEQKFAEKLGCTQKLESYPAYICDSFILGHSLNGVIGRGKLLDDFETGVASWSGSSCTLTSDTITFLVGAKSAKMVASSSPFNISTTQSFGDISAYSGVASGAPSTGTLGVWVYCTLGTEITSVTLRVGSDSSNYTEVAGVKGGYTSIIAGWNYFVFRLKNGATTGTPVWTAVAYARLAFVSSGTPTIYADYFTVGKGDVIALNGLGQRLEIPASYSIITVT